MRRNAFALVFLFVCGIALPASSQTYKFADLPGPSMTPFAINDGGDTAGQFCCAATNDIYDFPEMSYVSTSSSGFNVILPPQGLHINSFAAGLNNGDTVVGGYSDNSSVTHGFRFDAGVGTFKTLNFPGALSTAALGINDSSQIVGVFCTKKDACSSTVSSGDHCFSLVNGTYTQIDYPGAIATACNAVNSKGDIVGIYSSATQFKGFLYSNGVFTTIDPAPSLYSGAQGINDLEEIVGSFIDSSNKTHGFIYKAGTFTTFDAPGSLGTQLFGVNHAGKVVGTETILKGLVTVGRSFVATPQ
jgi:uncharacterized membrane protein